MGIDDDLAVINAGNLLGGGLVTLASVMSNVGANAQKRSHDQDAEKPEAERIPYIFRWFWWLGMVGVIGGSLADFVALGFASQPLVAALGGATSLMTNVLVAHFWNHEALFKTDIIGVICILIGATIFAITADEAREYSLEQLEGFFVNPGFVIYLSIQLLVVFFFLAQIVDSMAYRWRAKVTESLLRPIVNRLVTSEEKRDAKLEAMNERILWLEKRLERYESEAGVGISGMTVSADMAHSGSIDTGPSVALSPQQEAEHDTEQADEGATRGTHWVDQYLFAICSGAIGALSVLFAGCASKVIVESVGGNNQFIHGTPLLFVAGMIVCAVAQTHLLNRAMMVGDNMIVIPVFQASWTCFGVSGGVVFYNQGSVNLIGLVFMIVGVACFTKHETQQMAHDRGEGNLEGIVRQPVGSCITAGGGRTRARSVISPDSPELLSQTYPPSSGGRSHAGSATEMYNSLNNEIDFTGPHLHGVLPERPSNPLDTLGGMSAKLPSFPKTESWQPLSNFSLRASTDEPDTPGSLGQ